MPRGVKGSGPHAGRARKPKATAPAQAGTLPEAAPPVAPPSTAPVAALVQPSSPFAPRKEPPLGSVAVETLYGEELRRYARRAGVSPRDCESLTEDRLRQNTKLAIEQHIELLME